MTKLFIGLAFMLCSVVGTAQPGGPINVPPGSSGVIDGVVMSSHIPTKKVIAYPPLREADYIWSKMVWRTIDLREKMNYPLYYPLQPMNDRWSLWDILTSGIEAENITAYKPMDEEKFLTLGTIDGDQFRYPVSRDLLGDSTFVTERKNLLNDCIKTEVAPDPIDVDIYGDPIYADTDVDAYGNPIMKIVLDCRSIRAQDIIEYHIKEEWFFDKQRSVMDVRIIGIAPVRYITDNGQVVGKRELFWVYFPEARFLLQNFFTFNEQNRARRMSFDDLFWKRKFQSYIDKEENVFDRSINDHKVGVDALINAEDIKNKIFTFEHDLWHF